MLAGFDELILSCRTEEARSQIGEAIRCYEGASYRAAIVMSYMAVCFDLIDKLKALDAAGDGAAKTLIGELKKYQQQLDSGNSQAIQNLLAFERNLLEKFRDDFEFFGSNEFDELARLREDRNRCAHPTFLKSEQPYIPSAELARMHIQNALVLVLSQEPRQGKAALEEIRRAILSQYFPTVINDAAERFKTLSVSTARDSLVRAAVDDIVFGLTENGHPFFGKVPPYVALDALIEIRRGIAAPRAAVDTAKLLRSTSDDAIQIASLIVLRNKDVSELLDKKVRGVVETWIEKSAYPLQANAVRRALGIPWLKASGLKRLSSLTAEEMSKVNAAVPDEMLDRAAELYCGAKNWDAANDLAGKVGTPFADQFGPKQIEFIFDKAEKGSADLQGSHGFNSFISKLYDENPLGKDELDKLTAKYHLEAYRP